MVHEVQPKLDWDNREALLYLLDALGLDGDDVVPVDLGYDITDESAFETLEERGIAIFVGEADDPELRGRSAAADYVLSSTEDVEAFLDGLVREPP